MLRGGPQASAHDNSKQQQQQKQKKRLSFKDPEVEGPLRNYFFGGCKSKTLTKAKKPTNTNKTSVSVEDLTLEDQALQIAQNVGSAFSDLSITDNELVDFPGFDFSSADIESQRETEIRDSSPVESASFQRSCQLGSFKISAKDQEFLDALVPPLTDETMRGPTVDNNDLNSTKNCIPAAPEVRPSSSIQHQIQILRYQLEQQNQQTQMALHQVQLLQDQMEAESIARRKAQEQNNQLMQQNKELLNHMEKLFQQIEELERQILTLEQEKRGRRIITSSESQVPSFRQTISTASRRLTGDHIANDKSTVPSRGIYTAPKKSSVTATKPLTTGSKSSTQNSALTSSTKKNPNISTKPLADQSKTRDSGAKEKDALRIGDSSPTVQSATFSPFTSNWKLRTPDTSSQFTKDKPSVSIRSRTGSFTSYGKKTQDDTEKSTLFGGSNSSLLSTNVTTKKHSSSTSDLYNSSTMFQRKSSLTIEEPSTSVKTSVSNLSLNTTSKLPRYQPYTGWQRRTSLTGENEQVSAVSKESYKTPSKTTLFNR